MTRDGIGLELDKIYCMDCIEGLKQIENNSIDSVVTDPPYQLGFMGKKWDKTGITYNIKLWQEILRVCKPGAHLLSFGGTRTYHRMTCAIEDAGWEIRDTIMWIYGSGFPKSLNIGKKLEEWKGWGTLLKPAVEPITLARKPLSEKSIVNNVIKWGTGGLNIDKTRIPLNREKNPTGTHNQDSWRNTEERKDRQKIYPSKTSNLGRFPSNVIHDGSPEVTQHFPESTSIERRTQNINYQPPGKHGIYGKYGYIKHTPTYPGSGSVSRFFYCAKASKSERNHGLENTKETSRLATNRKKPDTTGKFPDNDNRKTRNCHPTVKPLKLTTYLITLITPPHGTILDPFLGSGTTALAAKQNGYHYIGIDNNPDYIQIANARLQTIPPPLEEYR